MNTKVIYMTKKRWLSPSSINTYMRCPRKFYLRYVRKLKSKPNIHLLRGSAVHKALERFFREGYAGERYAYYDDTRQALLNLFDDEWRDRNDTLQGLGLEDQDLKFYYSDSQKMLINWLHDYLKGEIAEEGSSELEKKIFSKKLRTMCVIDRAVQERPAIIDYKTCKSAELTDEYKRQMGVCSILYEELTGKNPEAFIHYLRFTDGLKKVPIDDDYKEYIKRLIIDVHHNTLSEDEKDYPCKCGGWCDKEFHGT